MIDKVFTEGFEEKRAQEGEGFLLTLLNSLYAEDLEFGGIKYACRRIRDTRIAEGSSQVRTEFFCFPQDGQKKKMERGLVVYIDSEAVAGEGKKVMFLHPKSVGYFQPDRHNLYRGVVSAKARGQIEAEGCNSFLYHDIYLQTPEKEIVLLDTFDFKKYPLFMLGFVSGEFGILLKEK